MRQGTDHVRFVAREHSGDAALLVVAVGDARLAASLRTLVELAQPRALFVAIVAVEALLSLAEIGVLARRFDAVLRVVVGREAEATAPLARALTAVTAFATADCISLPVDEVYPFFCRARFLTYGDADADDATTAAAMAVAAAHRGNTACGVRVLLHVETTRSDLISDLEAATSVIGRAVRLEDLWVTASVSRGGARKRVSFVAAGV